MDKKTIIGLVLIFAIFVGYMFWVAPSKDEIAERQRVYDSTMQANLEAQRVADSIEASGRQKAEGNSHDTSAISQQAESSGKEAKDLGSFSNATLGDERIVKVENSLLEMEIGSKGGQVQRVLLKGYQTYDSNALVLISPAEDNMNLTFSTDEKRTINTKELYFRPFVNGLPWNGEPVKVEGDDSAVVEMRAYASSDSVVDVNRYMAFVYIIRGDSYETDFDIDFRGMDDLMKGTKYMDLRWKNRMQRQEKVNSGSRGKGSRNSDRERYYSSIYYKTPNGNVDNLRMGSDKDDQVKTNLEWIAFKQQFFCAIMISNGDIPFENADLSVTTDKESQDAHYLADMSATVGLAFNPEKPKTEMGFFYGPTKFKDLRAMHRGYEKMLPLGWWVISKFVSKILIIPTFNFLEHFNWNYGIIIIVFTILFRLVLLPLVYKSYQGTAIMKALKPEMDELNKKYPNQEQAMQKQQAMMALQKRAGYSPMAGCLPMLIQIPIMTAMFMFFPVSIELRQKSFLWCNDLSTYDSVIDFGFNIPLYGDHISLMCLLMFGMQFFYTWYTMRNQQMNTSMPGMKFMMYFMPFMMLFMFNSQSAGLNLYYFMSLCFTMTTMMLIRHFTTEKKVRAKMAVYDKKHAGTKGKATKKSGFAKRLEEMQKMAEQMQRENKR